MGAVHSSRGLAAVKVGYRSIASVRRELLRMFPQARPVACLPITDLLAEYACGRAVPFAGILLDDEHLTAFGQRVTQVCRQIGYGSTVSYAELARRAGHPGAYRAAGNVMAKNRWPVVVPCHRVLTASGGLGGYSAPQGPAFKRRLLDLESMAAGA